MTRGDQRERAREKAAKKQAEKAKGTVGFNLQKKEADANIMRAKQEAALKKKEEDAAAAKGK